MKKSPALMGKRIRFIREFAELTQSAFGKVIGIGQGAVSACESDRENYQLHVKHAHVICEKFGASLDFIYRGIPGGITCPRMREAWQAQEAAPR